MLRLIFCTLLLLSWFANTTETEAVTAKVLEQIHASADVVSVDPIEIPSASQHTHKLKVAVCLTGQLLRLELLSKIRNFIVFNVMAKGHKMDTFIFLDNNENEEAHQTYWRFDYVSDSLYGNYTAKKLHTYIEKHISEAETNLAKLNHHYHFQHLKPPPASMVVRVRLAPPSQKNFSTINGKIPVDIKTGPFEGPRVVGDQEPAETRFQNNMRWMSGLRDCVKWVQATEHHQGWFYDLVVRLRDDTYVFGPWILYPEKYKGAFVTAQIASNFGVNDHNFVVDRYWADPVLRGLTEDYYFNETLDERPWLNPEHRIYDIARFKNVPFRFNDVCEMPLVPLRGKKSNTHWRLHTTYTKNLLEDCDPVKPPEDDDEEEEEEEEEAEVDDDDKTEEKGKEGVEANEKETLKPKTTTKPIKSPTSSSSTSSSSSGASGSSSSKGVSTSKSDPKVIRNRALLHDSLQLVSSSSSSSSSSSTSSSPSTRDLKNNRKQRYLAALNSNTNVNSNANIPAKIPKSDISTTPVKTSKPSLFHWITGSTVGDVKKQPTSAPVPGPSKLSERLAASGFKSCCSAAWLQILESEEAKIFL